NSSGAYATMLTWTDPQGADSLIFAYKNGGSWTSLTPVNMGNKFIFDTTSLAAATYLFDVRYTHAGESTPGTRHSGSFVVNGASGSISNYETGQSAYAAPASLTSAETARTQVQYDAFG